MAGIPDTVTACTINRVCTSAMESVVSGMAMIQAGMADIILAGGTEHMSGVPYAVDGARWGCRLQDQTFVDALIHGLYCGSRLLPLSDDGPLKSGELGIRPLARIRAIGHGGCHPSIMGLSPVPAVKDLFKRSNLKMEDFELIELNEAFAAQYIGCEREMKIRREIINVNGSGIGLGHPVGATGCRIMVTLLYAMRKRGKSLGLATLCGGGGVSMATAIEML